MSIFFVTLAGFEITPQVGSNDKDASAKCLIGRFVGF